MRLTIITPYSVQHNDITWLEIITPDGELTIQQGHAPIIFALSPHKKMTFMLKSGEIKEIHLNHSSFLEIQRNEATALINQE